MFCLLIKLDINFEILMRKTLQFNSNSNYDRISVRSKSSRLTKKNPEEENTQTLQHHYFQRNGVGDKVLQRTSKSKSIDKKANHLDRAGRIIEDLLDRHRKAKQKLQKLKQQSEKEHDRVCPFTPSRSPTQRYKISGDVVRRNEIWLREKKKKEIELKESVALQNLKECTFSPTFSSKKASEAYLKQKSTMNNFHNRTYENEKDEKNFSHFKSGKRDFSEAEYQMAKRNLISKMMNNSVF